MITDLGDQLRTALRRVEAAERRLADATIEAEDVFVQAMSVAEGATGITAEEGDQSAVALVLGAERTARRIAVRTEELRGALVGRIRHELDELYEANAAHISSALASSQRHLAAALDALDVYPGSRSKETHEQVREVRAPVTPVPDSTTARTVHDRPGQEAAKDPFFAGLREALEDRTPLGALEGTRSAWDDARGAQARPAKAGEDEHVRASHVEGPRVESGPRNVWFDPDGFFPPPPRRTDPSTARGRNDRDSRSRYARCENSPATGGPFGAAAQ